jgi:hypothetical protein
MQRAIGNTALTKRLALMRQGSQGVVQRKIGFEFQTDALVYKKDAEKFETVKKEYEAERDSILSKKSSKELFKITEEGFREEIMEGRKYNRLREDEQEAFLEEELKKKMASVAGYEIPPDKNGETFEGDQVLKMLQAIGKTSESYGERVFELPEMFHVEIDLGELEFVTEAFEEDADGAAQLITAVTLMQQFAHTALSQMRQTPKNVKTMQDLHMLATLRALSHIGGVYGKGNSVEEADDFLIGGADVMSEPRFTASPQASVGIGLDKLVELFELLGSDTESGNLLGMSANYEQVKGAEYQGDKMIKGSMYAEPAAAGRKAEGSQDLQGFVALLASYLSSALNWFNKKEDYPKMAHRLMARNDFRAMYAMLGAEQQEKFKNEYGPRKLLDLAGLQSWEPEDKIYKNGYLSDEGTTVEKEFVPNVQEWIESITQADAPHNKDRLSALPGQFKGRGMGQLKHMDPVSKGNEKLNPVFELRGLAKSVPLDKWTDIAFEVYEAIMTVKGAFPGMKLEDIKEAAKKRSEETEFPKPGVLKAKPEPPAETYPIPNQ